MKKTENGPGHGLLLGSACSDAEGEGAGRDVIEELR